METCKRKSILVDLGIFTYIPAYSDVSVYSHSCLFKNYSGIFTTLFKSCRFRTLLYSDPEAYVELWHIQKTGIYRTLAYSEPEAYSVPWYI